MTKLLNIHFLVSTLALIWIPCLVSSEETAEGCYTGLDVEVREHCHGGEGSARCCVGPEACVWPATMKVTVCPMSCGGIEACKFTNPLLIQDQEIYIGNNSCRLAGSCKDFGAYFETDKSMTIGTGSCIGTEACHAAAGNIADGSCRGEYSCQAAGGNIGENSCLEDDACFLAMDVGDCVATCDRLEDCAGSCDESSR